MLAGAMIVWFALTAASLVLVLLDFHNTPISWVQKLAWGLVIAYTGPVGLVVYLLACRNPGPGLHDAFTKPLWKQAVNSEMHCVAGDATGIVIAAGVLSVFALPWGWDVAIEYVAAFATGLFIFQAMMMRSMFSSYRQAVRRTIFAETVSMNMVMAGMIPVMVLLEVRWPDSSVPWHWSFWFRMGLAVVAGGLTAYPINHWLVARGYKHGCMTLVPQGAGVGPAAGQRAHGQGGATHEHADHAHMQHEHAEHAHHDTGTLPATAHDEHQMHHGHTHAMPSPSGLQQVAWSLFTGAALAAALGATWLLR